MKSLQGDRYTPIDPHRTGPSKKTEAVPCELCGMLTRARCPVCQRKCCAICSLADDQHHCCPQCAGLEDLER